MSLSIRPLVLLFVGPLVACAASHSFQVEATATEVVAGDGEELGRQVLVEVVVTGGERIQMPRVMTLDGRPASLFVGTVDAEGRESGLLVDVSVAGDEAHLVATRKEAGVVQGSVERCVPVEAAGAR